jgi:hypothetical protein
VAAVQSLEQMLAARTLWHAGRSARIVPDGASTGLEALDALLPQGGWPRRALTELLLPGDGVGELSLLLPTLARITQGGGLVALVSPPYLPYAPAWQAAGVDLAQLQLVQASPRDALWAFEQCLRSGACEAVLGWPATADAQALRRLQVAADSGDCLGFALRDRRHAANPSPAALRLEAVRDPTDAGIAWRVRKCRGGPVPAATFVPRSQTRDLQASPPVPRAQDPVAARMPHIPAEPCLVLQSPFFLSPPGGALHPSRVEGADGGWARVGRNDAGVVPGSSLTQEPAISFLPKAGKAPFAAAASRHRTAAAPAQQEMRLVPAPVPGPRA